MRVTAFTLVLCMVSVLALAQDPVKTDGDKCKIVLENDRVRVMEYRDKPGDKTALHHHPDFAMTVVSPFTRRLTFEDGHTVRVGEDAGVILFSPQDEHSKVIDHMLGKMGGGS